MQPTNTPPGKRKACKLSYCPPPLHSVKQPKPPLPLGRCRKLMEVMDPHSFQRVLPAFAETDLRLAARPDAYQLASPSF